MKLVSVNRMRCCRIHEFHPFRNHFGFVSAVPTGTAGSILMGREESGTDKELRMIR